MSGVIQGGWEYVALAYGFTFGLLAVYSVAVARRLLRSTRESG